MRSNNKKKKSTPKKTLVKDSRQTNGVNGGYQDVDEDVDEDNNQIVDQKKTIQSIDDKSAIVNTTNAKSVKTGNINNELMADIAENGKYFSALIDFIPPKIYFEGNDEIMESMDSQKKQRMANNTKSGPKGKHLRFKLDPNSDKRVSDIASEFYGNSNANKKTNNSNKTKKLNINSKDQKMQELKQKLNQKIIELKSRRGQKINAKSLRESKTERKRINSMRAKKQKGFIKSEQQLNANQTTTDDQKPDDSMETIIKNNHKKIKREVHEDTEATIPEKVKEKLPKIYNSDGNIVYSKFDFFSTNESLSETKKLSKKNKLKKLLAKTKIEENKLSHLEATDSMKAKQFKEKKLWKNAIDRSEGIKVKNSSKMIEKSIKKKKQLKQKSAKKWSERKEALEKRMNAKSEKRKRNIDQRKTDKKERNIKRQKKKGRIFDITATNMKKAVPIPMGIPNDSAIDSRGKNSRIRCLSLTIGITIIQTDYSEHVIKDEPTIDNKKSASGADTTNKKNQSNSLILPSVSYPTTSGDDSQENTTTVRLRSRTRELPKLDDNPTAGTDQQTSPGGRRTTRPKSSTDTTTPTTSSTSTTSATVSLNNNSLRNRTKASELRLEPEGADFNDKTSSPSPKSSAPKRIQKILQTEESGGHLGGGEDHTDSPDVEFILRVKTATKAKEADEESIAFTDTTETTLCASSADIEEYQTKISSLLKQLDKSEDSIKQLDKQNSELQAKIKRMEKLQENRAKQITESDKQAIEKTASELLKLRGRCRELEALNTELKDEKNVLRIEVKELTREVEVMKKDNPKELKETITNLRLKLQQTEHLVENLTEENEEIKKDVKALEIEFQELHDNFREDQSSEFRVLKRELESSSKNCRVLQFKLKKAERGIEVMENDKLELEKKVKDLLETTKIDVDKQKMKELENELSIAKEVSLRLHAEIETLREERVVLEQQLTEGRNPSQQKSLNRLSTGKLSPSVSIDGKDYEQVIRDLYDTMEREKDLQEQMKFAEEETRTLRKKLSTMESENEILSMQIRKMVNQKSKKGGDIGDDDTDELSIDEMKLNLELYEQEMIVLRRKTDELEQENDNFQQEIKYLQDKLVSQPLVKIEMPELPPGSPPNVIYEHKFRILEAEARDLRKKLVDREKEYESLRTEIEVHRRKASKVIIRSRSLDSEQQVDLKRQLQLVEQEASILRQKLMSLENENDKLINDNKRYQLRLSRKPPPGPADQLQVENIELKDKIKDLERRCENIKSDLMASKSQPNLNFLMSDTESDLINTLKKQLKIKETDITELNARLSQSDVECNRLNREYKKLKETVSAKRHPTRVVRETATRGELKEIIKEMEEDINDLHNTVKGKDLILENLNEELSEVKRDPDNHYNGSGGVTQNGSGVLQVNEKLRKELENERKKSHTLQMKMDSFSKEKGFDLSALDNLDVLQAEKKQLAIKLDDIQEELTREKTKSEDLSQKVIALNKLQEELTKKFKTIEMQNEKFEDECDSTRDQLKKSDNNLKEMTNKCDLITKELSDLKKVSQQLKIELDREKLKSNANSNQSGGGVTTVMQKEIDELKKKLNDMTIKADNLRKQNEELDKEFKQKELKLKEETAKKVEIAVNGVRKEVHLELQQLKEETNNSKSKISELNDQLDKANRELKESNDRLRVNTSQVRKERDDLQNRLSDLESQLRSDSKRREKLEKEHELTIKSKDQELFQTRERIVQMERELRKSQQKLDNTEYESNNKVVSLEKDLTKEREEYEELTNKYDLLEKEFLEMKSRLVTEKETLAEAVSTIRKSYDEKLMEIKSLKDMLSKRQKEWVKEKLDLQERSASLESKVSRASFVIEENLRLKEMINEKESLLESYRKEEKHVKTERDNLRKRCDELAMKIADMEKVERMTRTVNITGKDKELQEYKIRLEHTQTSHKGEVAALHAEYEGRMRLMGDEINELQRQIAFLANERDRFKDQLNRDPSLRRASKYKDEVEDIAAQLLSLRSDLEAALLENRNLKIQFGTERSGWQIQSAELKTQINQLEERILLDTARGSTRSYVKTKLELAWDKERQENLRLLQETQKFIQDLRDKLMNTEKVREKDRLEQRKQLQDLKSGMDRESEDTHKRVSELQLDLLDLREAHAKVRSQNERLRRERNAYEGEREEWKNTVFSAFDIQNKAHEILGEIEEITKLIPNEPDKPPDSETTPTTTMTTTVVRRRKTQNAINIVELRNLVTNLKTKSDEIKNLSLPTRDVDRLKYSVAFKRTISAQDMPVMRGSSQSLSRAPLPLPREIIRAPPRPKALAKKSVSLDYQIGASGQRGASQERIWESGDSANTTPTSSVSNLRVSGHYRGFTALSGYESDASHSRYTREGSFGADSDTSLPAVPQSKKSLFKFIKKTRSIEDSTIGGGIASAGLTSLAVHGFEESPIELAKQRQKKENSLKHKISKTLSKTFSRSSSSLQTTEDKKEKRPTSPNRALSPTRKSGKPSPVPSDQEGYKSGAKPALSGVTSSMSTQRPLVSKLAIPPSTRPVPPQPVSRFRSETNV
ncbi:kinesin-related protein 4-like [Oppia nitens]|uniref:kinesin-related protein 4-like n=1 Tax=Oppia nitens TaxID=1686743 RepID=UPI0023D9B749|nr:kinesin-related protein 4-like [Oppia nitens]